MSELAALIERVHQQFLDAPLAYGHGVDNAWDEAVWLALHATGLADDERSLATPVDPDVEARVLELAERRVRERVPMAYLLGECWFAGHPFAIEPGVVIPRSPIAGLIMDAFAPWLTAPPERVLDLCTGSGCIGIAVAKLFEDASVDLVEIETQALEIAKRNVALHELEGRVTVIASDLFEAVEGPYDLIVSNPPYVDAGDMAARPMEFRHEPELGLAAGEDGMEVVQRILDQAADYLTPQGLLVCEVGGSAAALSRMRPELPFTWPGLSAGGEGVFLLDAQALRSHTARL